MNLSYCIMCGENVPGAMIFHPDIGKYMAPVCSGCVTLLKIREGLDPFAPPVISAVDYEVPDVRYGTRIH